MEQGIFIIWSLAFGMAALAWLCVGGVILREGRCGNRRQITGCELARQVLDRNHLSRIPVHLLSTGGRFFGFSLDQLFLPENVYKGTCLSELAFSLHLAFHLVEGPRLIVTHVWSHGRGVTRRIAWTSFALILLGSLWPAVRGLVFLGEFLFVTVFLFALSALPAEWQVTEKGISELAQMEGFGPDELTRVRKLLKALRWAFLAELSPFSVFGSGSRNRPSRAPIPI